MQPISYATYTVITMLQLDAQTPIFDFQIVPRLQLSENQEIKC